MRKRAGVLLSAFFISAASLLGGNLTPGDPLGRVEAIATGDLTGTERQYQVVWYDMPTSRTAKQPEIRQFLRGVSVMDRRQPDHSITNWMAPPTTILAFYPAWNRLLPLAPLGGALVTLTVQYGAKAMNLYVLRLERSKLVLINTIAGQGTFSFQKMGTPPRWVIDSDPNYMGQMPSLYAWNGSQFVPADRDFPEFWLAKANAYANAAKEPGVVPAYVLVQECEQIVRAFRLARRPKRARKPCVAARERVASGTQVWKPPGASLNQLAHDRKTALSEIDRLLSGLGP